MPENIETLATQPEIVKRLQLAFPNSLAYEVYSTLALIPAARLKPTQRDIGSVIISGEQLHIPSRFYSPVPDEISFNDLRGINPSILACIYTRHHNGFVRLKYLNKLFNVDDLWAAPFVLQLIGEYGIEIIEVISQNIKLLPVDSYQHFINENPSFTYLLKQRIISYWNCYYRFQFPHFKDYVGFQVGDALRLWKRDDVKHLLAR